MTFAEKFILLPRSVFLTDAWWQATGDQVKAYLDLCFRVAYCESEYKCRYGNIKLQKGQMVMSYRNLGKDWNWDFNKVYRMLNSLETIGLIRIDIHGERFSEHTKHQITILTVNALSEHKDDDSERICEQDNNNNLSNDKFNTNNVRAKKFVKPTPEEVQAELDKRGIVAFTGQDFWSYYESCGWTVGRNKPMKSWKDCINTWVRFQKNNSKNDTKINFSPHDRKAEAAQRHQEFTEHIIRKLNGQEQCPDELPFQ